MDDQTYIASLEMLVISLAGFHEECKEAYAFDDATCDRFPLYQGTPGQIAIQRISRLPQTPNTHGFSVMLEEMARRLRERGRFANQ